MLGTASFSDKSPIEKHLELPDNEVSENLNDFQRASCCERILLNRPLKAFLIFALCSIILPPLLYQYLFSSYLDHLPADSYSIGSCYVQLDGRKPCGHPNTTESTCHAQCCFDSENSFCFHRYPSRFSYILDRTWVENSVFQPRIHTEPYAQQSSINSLVIAFDEISKSHLSVILFDILKYTPTRNTLNTKHYSYEVFTPELEIVIKRENDVVLQTDKGPQIVSENIWEWSFNLKAEELYGLGEIPLRSGFKKVFYSYDQNTAVPLIFARQNGKFHGVYINTTVATEIEILPSNHIIVRSISNDSFNIHLFTGPTPTDIYNEMSKLSESLNAVQFWQFGLHICNEVSSSPSNALRDLQEFLQQAQEKQLPFDSHCGALPLELNSETLNSNVEHFIQAADSLTEHGKKFVPHLYPYINYSDNLMGREWFSNFSTVFLVNATSNSPYIGVAHGHTVLYPDYIVDESSQLLKHFLPLGLEIKHGVILENNWPIDESEKDLSQLALPYMPEELKIALTGTLHWNTSYLRPDSTYPDHLHLHGLYGHHHIERISTVMNTRNIFSSSLLLHSRAGYNRQNLDASWTNFNAELVNIALAGVSGFPIWMTPICGDGNINTETQTELCTKWYRTASLLPFVKLHSKKIRLHPFNFNGVNSVYMIEAIRNRYILLPYLYTSFKNGPLFKPMFYQYPNQPSLHNIKSMFAVGDAILVAPNLLPNQTWLNLQLPSGFWFEFWGGARIEKDIDGHVTIATVLADTVILIKGGAIVPIQEDVQLTAESTRIRSPYTLVVALHHTGDNPEKTATGQLRIDENLVFDFKSTDKLLSISKNSGDLSTICNETSKISSNKIEKIKMYGKTYKDISLQINLCDLEIYNVPVEFYK